MAAPKDMPKHAPHNAPKPPLESPRLDQRHPTASDGSPPLTPESIARSEFGRSYWSGQVSASLDLQQQSAAERLAGERQAWRAALRKRLSAQSKEWAKRRAKARQAKAVRDNAERDRIQSIESTSETTHPHGPAPNDAEPAD